MRSVPGSALRPSSLHPATLLSVFLALVLTACDSSTSSPRGFGNLECSVPANLLFDGGPGVDGIPALQSPPFVSSDSPAASYLLDTDRVIGIVSDGEAFAVPHNILWWHEIVNMDLPDGRRLAVTYCPLTGSSLVFDRGVVGGATLGVSGLIFQNNLVIWDRRDPESLWSQMGRQGICGPEDGTELAMVGSWETTWEGWKKLHPDTRVISGNLGMARNYTLYPYGPYEDLNNQNFLFPQPSFDQRRAPKERILGIPSITGEGGIAFPFLELEAQAQGGMIVVESRARGEDVVVFWDSEVEGAMAYRPRAGGTALTFRSEGDAILDDQTGSRWRMDGLAAEGPLAGERLEPVAEAYVAFWFAWVTFQPDTDLWSG